MKRSLVVGLAILVMGAHAWAGEIGYVEDFALAADRTAALKQLIPGTEDYYYYHCLHYLNTEQYQKVDQLLPTWIGRHGQTARVIEIQSRLALLVYDRDPQRTLNYLRNRLNLQFNHQKEVLGAAPNLPVALDPNLIARPTLVAHAFAHWSNLEGFEDTALDWLVEEKLTPERRRNLLQRLQRPDHRPLPQLVIDDLRFPNSAGFGSAPIHARLTLAQLEECVQLAPELLNQPNYVNAYLSKLRPSADDDWRHDPKLLKAYLDRLLAFVRRLAPVHNSLKAHVLYQALLLERSQGVYDQAKFLEYLTLPRNQGYMARVLLERAESRQFPADLNADYSGVTLLAPIGSDEALVRSFLKHLFAEAASYKDFEPFINETYLKHLFAETKIELGLGEPEQWASLLPPEQFQQLKERIDLDFAFTNRTLYAADEPVQLDVFIKNVPTLIVKVFEINTRTYYRQQQKEVNTDINLDGLVANEEETHRYDEPSLRRMPRRFSFPKLNRAGVFVIDFIGNGKSSRALVRKGKLRPVVRTGAAGQVFTVFDERNQQVLDAAVWLAGHEYRADAKGNIVVPFSTSPGRQSVVISRGDFASFDSFNHEPENYALSAGIYVDREALLTRKHAEVILRPALTLNGAPVGVSLLEEVKLLIRSTDLDGVVSAQEVSDLKLFEDRETMHEFNVPARLASIAFTLKAKVKSLSRGQPVDLAAEESFALNEIDRTDKVEDLHLARFGANYVLELRGRTGEPMTDRAIQLALKHRDFKTPVQTTLKTSARGQLMLGPLPGIDRVTATGPENTTHTWPLRPDAFAAQPALHGRVGEVLLIPYMGTAAEPLPRELALLELRDDTYAADRFDALGIEHGLLTIKGLAAGDYELWLKDSGTRVLLRIGAGEAKTGFVLGQHRYLELPLLPALQIADIVPAADKLTIRINGASKFARVHVFGTRYVPAYSAFEHLAKVRSPELRGVYPAQAESMYLTGRNIGDEYRYVIDRKYAKKFPGNLLDRPSLLLNPWAVRSTEVSEQQARGGEDFAPRAPMAPSEAMPGGGSTSGAAAAGRGDFANLDFLAEATALFTNLAPDKDGAVVIPRAALGAHQHIHVVAVDPLHTVYKSIALPEPKENFVDLRLHQGLDPKEHFTQQKQITVVGGGQPFVMADITSSKFEAYDSLARVYGLYATLSHDAALAEFSFILNWPKLKPEEKHALYSKYACHELSFFLARKDPEFFRQVIRPYLANKKDKTFLDRWLLEEDLAAYGRPWQYGQLNIVERILLAQRLEGERPKTTRHVNDLFNLLPPNLDRFLLLFDTAVKGTALETQDAFGYHKEAEKRAAAGRLQLKLESKTAGVEAAPAPAKPEQMQEREVADEDRMSIARRDAESGRRKLKEMGRSSRGRAAGFGGGGAKDVFFDQGADRKQVRAFYRKLDKTMEWAENNYYHLPISQQNADLITVNAFWRDWVQHDPAQPFLSRNLAEASRNFPEMMFALAVLDLPFEAKKHATKFDGARMTVAPAGPMIVFHEEVKPVRGAPAGGKVLVSENFYRQGDRYRQENNEQVDKFITDEFLIHTVYGCQVVVTNATSSRQKLSVLLQIPRGAIPVANSYYTRTVHLDLEPYRTQTLDVHFYFPLPGRFEHFPVHVARNEVLIAAAEPFTFNVVATPTKIDAASWDYVSQNGSAEDVLAFLAKNNVQRLNLERIAFRLRDARFFESVLALLRDRHVFQPTLWSYGILHNALPALREYLQHASGFVNECGGRLVSSPLVIDPVERHTYEHLEYKPLVNARAHALGKRREILNNRFFEQYHRYLRELAFKRQLAADDFLAVTYYLLLQDRVEEALATFVRVDAGKLATRLQYDYFAAYFDLYTGDLRQARAVATQYTAYPVDRWRNAFAAIGSQLNEIEGKAAQVVDRDNLAQQQTKLAATEPGFEFQVEARQIKLQYQNLATVRIHYYLMDVELLFSKSPFLQQFGSEFSAIQPNQTQAVKLPPNQPRLVIDLPATLHNRNVLVEIEGAGTSKMQAYYSHSLDLQLVENYGQLRVTDVKTTRPIAKAYVKVYARLSSGEVKFYKDGYTDLRGRFDYASLSTDELNNVARFAILVLSDAQGAIVREAAPPKQ